MSKSWSGGSDIIVENALVTSLEATFCRGQYTHARKTETLFSRLIMGISEMPRNGNIAIEEKRALGRGVSKGDNMTLSVTL